MDHTKYELCCDGKIEWWQVPPTPVVSCPAAYTVLSRRDSFLLEVVKALLSSGKSWKDQYDLAKVAAGYTDAVLKEADKTP